MCTHSHKYTHTHIHADTALWMSALLSGTSQQIIDKTCTRQTTRLSATGVALWTHLSQPYTWNTDVVIFTETRMLFRKCVKKKKIQLPVVNRMSPEMWAKAVGSFGTDVPFMDLSEMEQGLLFTELIDSRSTCGANSKQCSRSCFHKWVFEGHKIIPAAYAETTINLGNSSMLNRAAALLAKLK